MATILSINNYYYRRGGAESVFLEHNKLFGSLGWKVVPFAMHHPQNQVTEWSEFFVEEIEYEHGYSIFGKIRRVPKVIYSFESRRKLRALLKKIEPDICHLHNIYHHISPSILGLLRQHHVPMVLTLHDLKLACPSYKMLTHDGICERCKGGKVYNVMLHKCVKQSVTLSSIVFMEAIVHRALGSFSRYVDRFIVPSRFLMEKMVEWGWDPGRFRYIPNFVEVELTIHNTDVGDHFLYVGRLARDKGLETLIRAAALAKVPLRIAGRGPDETYLKSVAGEFSGDIRFLGHLEKGLLQEAIRAARAVVLPSELYENAPLSILESYVMGRPAIGSSLGGIPELIREDETGWLFPAGSIDHLAQTLRQVADMPSSVVANMGRAGRDWVERDFTKEKYRDRVLGVYKEVMGKSKR